MSKCQMPNCNNDANVVHKKSGVFCGVHLDEVSLLCCENHNKVEIDAQLNMIGNKESNSFQKKCNTFMEARKVLYHIS